MPGITGKIKDVLSVELRSYRNPTLTTIPKRRFRWSHHFGVSHRTLRPLTKIDFSLISQHSKSRGHHISFQNFKMIVRAPTS